MFTAKLATLATVLLAALPRVAGANCPVPGFNYAAFGDTGVSVGNGNTDSWDSTLNSDSYDSSAGSYASTKCTSKADCVGGVATNSVADGGISLGPNADVDGQCTIGAGGSTSSITPNSKNCDSLGVLAAPLVLPVPTLPTSGVTDLGSISGSLTINAPGNYKASSISLSGQSKVNIDAGPVVLFLTGNGSVLSMSGNGAMNNNTKIPTNLVIMCTGTGSQTLSLVGNGNAYYGIYCPNADITIAGNGTIYGAVVGKSVRFNGNNGYIHYDKALKNFTTGSIQCVTEISRSAPIVAAISNQSCVVQGTYEFTGGSPKTITSTADVADFQFPAIIGHLRARVASTIGTSAADYSSGTIVFDAANGIPPVQVGGCALANGAFSSSCRNVFTNTNTTPANGTTSFAGAPMSRITRIDNSETVASTVGPLVAPSSVVSGIGVSHYKTIMARILAGTANGSVARLGGVDHSTVAVIGPSSYAGSSSRPTMAYFGGTDGMLHAVCASTGGTTASGSAICPATLSGTELWAFLPRVQLPLVRTNKQRIDGSVRVVDAFGTFPDPVTGEVSGTRTWRTILTFQTGYSDATTRPAVYALDVTDPAKPILLWEYTTPSVPSTDGFELGVGLAMHAGPTMISSTITNLAIAQTNNGGTGGTGMLATALALETGERKWDFGVRYVGPSQAGPRGVAADNFMPAAGIPGGAVGIDLAGGGFTTDVVMGDLYGNLWRVDAATGVSATGITSTTPALGFPNGYSAGNTQFGNTPLFTFTTNKHPIGALPTIYDNGFKIAVFGSGAYVDPEDTTPWTTTNQKLIGVRLAGTVPLNDTTPVGSTVSHLAIEQDLADGEKVASQVLVVGTQLLFTTDTSNINATTYGTTSTATGSSASFTFTATSITTLGTLQGGASALVNDGTKLYAGSSSKAQQLATTATSTDGTSVDYQNTKKATRLLFLQGRADAR